MVDYNSRRLKRFSRRKKYFGNHDSHIVLWSRLAKLLFFGFIACIIIGVFLFYWYSRDLPQPGKLANAPLGESTKIYDRNGILLYSLYQNQNRTYVKLPQIPLNLQHATIAVEDRNFYQNQGFSLTGYLRAIRDIVLYHQIQGGSTLTQQLVKNVLLTSQQSISRKIKELILAIQVDKKYSKDQILEMYLNDVPYGGTAVGVEAGAEEYFGKNVKDLDLAQSAFLAGLPQSPSEYSPYSGNKYYIDRTAIVLQALADQGYITQKQNTDALSEIKNTQFSQNDSEIKAPHFVMYVKALLARDFGEQYIENGALKIVTTLDYSIQKQAEQIVKSQVALLKPYHVSNGAAIVTDPKTGEILAMVGSEDYFDTANDGNFNVAISTNRQPGSSLKPIVYATALEQGYTASTMVMDVQTNFKPTDSDPDYIPVNYSGKFAGPMQLRFALGNSENIPAVKMLARVGLKAAMQQGYNMGISTWDPTPQNLSTVGLSLVLGGKGVSLLDETTAYGVFATGGIRHDPVSILSVSDSKGNSLYQYKPNSGTRVLPDGVAFIISHILLDNNARTAEFGPNSYLVIPGKTVSVKTGTTDEKRDNWASGYTPSYVVGVWVGNNDNTPMNPIISSGETGASPIWNRIMTAVLKGKPDEQPKKPDDVIAMQIDALGGGLPVPTQPQRSEYFIKGTEPTASSPIYKNINGKDYLEFKEDDPVSTDGKNRWQEGIDAWIDQNHKDDPLYHPPDEPTPTPTPTGTLTPTQTPTPTPG